MIPALDGADVLAAFERQIADKTAKTEAESGAVDPLCLRFVREAYREVMAVDMDKLPARREALGNDDLRKFLALSSALHP